MVAYYTSARLNEEIGGYYATTIIGIISYTSNFRVNSLFDFSIYYISKLRRDYINYIIKFYNLI